MVRPLRQCARLIIGLGNPGEGFVHTRHNIGFKVIDHIADAYAIRFDQNRFGNLVGWGTIGGVDAVLAKPQLYMNRSGPPVLSLVQDLGIRTVDMLVIHDDMDLAMGQIKIKEKGGHGGHRGVMSLIDALGSGDFPRLRVGIGRPPAGTDAADHVLSLFMEEEREHVTAQIRRAGKAVVTILCDGTRMGMNMFNRKPNTVQMEVKR